MARPTGAAPLFDLFGRLIGQPTWQTLGSNHTAIPAHVSNVICTTAPPGSTYPTRLIRAGPSPTRQCLVRGADPGAPYPRIPMARRTDPGTTPRETSDLGVPGAEVAGEEVGDLIQVLDGRGLAQVKVVVPMFDHPLAGPREECLVG